MVVLLTAPVLPGRAEAWRRMCQELLGSRAEHFSSSACRLGVRSQRIWLVPIAHAELAVIQLDLAEPDLALADLASSSAPFDIWLRRQIQYLIGVDLAALAEVRGEIVLEWKTTEDGGRRTEDGGRGTDTR